MNFQYSFNIPKAYFGNYTNSVTAYVSTAGVDNVSATNVAYVGSEVPDNGLFDSVLSRIFTGLGLVTFAGIVFYFDRADKAVINVFGYGARLKVRNSKIEKKKSKFEKGLNRKD